MDHVAIMKKSWKLIPKILSGEKTIESRWYQTKRAPWNAIRAGETIFFKNSGESVTAQASVQEVIQREIENLNDAKAIVKKYGKEICLVNPDLATWSALPRYCILLRLKNPKRVSRPFDIDKRGFGAPAAWLTVDRISKIKIDK